MCFVSYCCLHIVGHFFRMLYCCWRCYLLLCVTRYVFASVAAAVAVVVATASVIIVVVAVVAAVIVAVCCSCIRCDCCVGRSHCCSLWVRPVVHEHSPPNDSRVLTQRNG